MSAVPTAEHQLIQRARAGDEDAFTGLVTLHADRVYGALRRFGLSEDEADEVAQEVFVRAWRGLARFEGRAQFSTWLYRIAFNQAQRRRSRRALARADGEDPIVALPDSPDLDPEAQTLSREFEHILDRALGQLPAERRTRSFCATSRDSPPRRPQTSWGSGRRHSRAASIVGACDSSPSSSRT